MFRWISPTAAVLAVALPFCAAGAQDPKPAPATATLTEPMVEVRTGGVKWGPIEVTGFAKGMQIATLYGDPSQQGPYTIRLKFPAGYAFPPHWHPMTENLTVLSGKFFLGMGEKSDRAALKSYSPGDYIALPAKMPHFGRVEGETVVQLHGLGPFEIQLVQPAAGAPRK